jgi:hypothetical protein
MLNRGKRRRGVSQVWTRCNWREAGMGASGNDMAVLTRNSKTLRIGPAVEGLLRCKTD